MDLVRMIKLQLRSTIKNPIMPIIYFLIPTVLTLSIGYLTQDSFGSNMSSYEYYSIGMTIFTYIASGISSAYCFIDKPMISGNFRLIFTPSKTINIYLSQILSGTIFCSLGVGFSMILYKLLFNIDYNGNFILIFLAYATMIFMSNALGILICTMFKSVVAVNLVFNVIQTVLCILGGAFFSMEALGEVPAAIAKISPVKWLMDGILNSLYDNNITIISIIIVVNFIIGIALIFACKFTFKTEKYI